jgi:hypothetical protein
LKNAENTINTTASTTEAYASKAEETSSGKGYVVGAKAEPSGAEFVITKTAEGAVTRTCTPVSSTNGCPTGDW